MRAIKFRVFEKFTKTMIPWGHLKEFADLNVWIEGEDTEEYSTVMQFTGLSDKTGVEIYEGDIVKDYSGDKYEVIFDEYMFNLRGYYDSFADYPSDAFSEGVFEVIGNIYENPELLR